MNTVYKYVINPDVSALELPRGAKILSVAFQRDDFCMWAKVDTEAEIETRAFRVFGTGHDIPRNMGINYRFVGTAHMDNGLVFHAFEFSL